MDEQQPTQDTSSTETQTATLPVDNNEQTVQSDNLVNPSEAPESTNLHTVSNSSGQAESSPESLDAQCKECGRHVPDHEENCSIGREQLRVAAIARTLQNNNNAERWKTAEERILACERYCQYLRMGRSKAYYPEADENTINRYMDKYPSEFRTEKIREAERAGLSYIESIGFKGMTGHLPGFNPTAWIWITKNKLKWKDRIDHTTNEKQLPTPIMGGLSNVPTDDSDEKAS